ncbi:MAG: LysE family translocator [Chloroflexales bacterium]|nr:LysE family translocator [Chloroflexales bacterium]
MPTPTTLAWFAVAALALLLIPGPVVLFTIARSVERGWRAGLVSTLAAGVGDSCHVLAATLGLSALLLSSALAFAVVKYAGAAYLVYLGIMALRSRPAPPTEALAMPASRIFVQGVIVSVLNPKTALFFLAFLPQFVAPAQGPIPAQILILGALFVTLGVVVNTGYALLAGGARALFQGNPALVAAQQRLAGVIYLILGITAAFAGASKAK